MRTWIRLAPGAPDLPELGDPATFLTVDGRPAARMAGAEIVRERRDEVVRRLAWPPLGNLHVHEYQGALADLWRARFTTPRSASLAERAWNVFCELAAGGVGTPDLLAVGAVGQGLVSGRSFLVVRPPGLAERLSVWRAGRPDEDQRALGERALALAAERVAQAGFLLPRADPDTVWLTPNSGGHDCGPGDGGAPLPGVLFTDVGGARRVGPRAAVDTGLVERLGVHAAGVPAGP